MIVSIGSSGSAIPARDTVPYTITILSGASIRLSTADTVTEPALSVAFAEKLSMFPVCVKSAETAGATGCADTITSNGSEEAGHAIAVTVPIPPFSLIEPGIRTSDTSGAVSSSVIVSVTSAGASASDSDTVPDTVTILSGASIGLSTAPISHRSRCSRSRSPQSSAWYL